VVSQHVTQRDRFQQVLVVVTREQILQQPHVARINEVCLRLTDLLFTIQIKVGIIQEFLQPLKHLEVEVGFWIGSGGVAVGHGVEIEVGSVLSPSPNHKRKHGP
jgi:hypothetical protein